MVTLRYLCLISVLVTSSHGFEDQKSVASRNAEPQRSFNDGRLFSVKLQDSNTQATDQWKAIRRHGKYARIQTTPDMCKAFVQGLVDSSTGELMWDEHRCTVLTLVVKCHAKVRVLSRSGERVLAEGEDNKELFLEILVDEGNKRIIPLDGIASRDLAILLLVHQLQEKRDRPDFHLKKQKALGEDFFSQDHPSNGWFPECN